MYQFSYSDVIEESSQTMRQREREAFDRVIGLLKEGLAQGVGSKPAIEGMYFLRRLWGILGSDLRDRDNELPQELRNGLLAIEAWIYREIQQIQRGETSDLSALIEINQIVRDGLR